MEPGWLSCEMHQKFLLFLSEIEKVRNPMDRR